MCRRIGKGAEHASQSADPYARPSGDPVMDDNTPVGASRDPSTSAVPPLGIAAFCETQGFAAVVAQMSTDRRMGGARVAAQMGGFSAAIELYRKSPTPNLIFVESQADDAQLFACLEALAEVCLTKTKVVVVGHRNDVALYRELIHRGISDYLVFPLEAMALVSTVARLYRDVGSQKIGRICAFLGASGGAGSSSMAHNTAWAIASGLHTDVLLADLDFPFGTVGLNFNLEASQGILDVIRTSERLDAVLLERLVVKRGDRLSLLTPPLALDGAYDLGENEFERLIDLARGRAGITILDLPHMWTSTVRRLLLDADEVVITATPDLAGMRNTKAMAEFLKAARPHDGPPRLVLNQIGVPRRPQIKVPAFAAAVDLAVGMCVPFEPTLFGTAANNGQMIEEVSARHRVAKCFAEFGQALAGGKGSAPARTGMGSRVLRLFRKG